MKTVVGLYNTLPEANIVKSKLESQGYEAAHVTVIDQTDQTNSTSSTPTHESISERVKGFFNAFSDHNDEHNHYSKRIGNGGALLAVTVPDGEAEQTAELLYEHGATGIQGDNGTAVDAEDVAVLQSNSNAQTNGLAGEQLIPVVQEQLVVGKRNVERGGVRIYSHIVEEPVSADVTLRNEQVVVDRQAVNRPATEADFSTGAGVVELTATGEEAVVGKASRVVEEIRVGKQSSEHTEQIQDTVRHTEVDVEPTEVLVGNRR